MVEYEAKHSEIANDEWRFDAFTNELIGDLYFNMQSFSAVSARARERIRVHFDDARYDDGCKYSMWLGGCHCTRYRIKKGSEGK